MYKVVLAGDAAVGKSSFIMRLCKNKFVSNLHSTLGVDFQTKILEVDGRVIALQLWDTAGQERYTKHHMIAVLYKTFSQLVSNFSKTCFKFLIDSLKTAL